MKSQTNGNKLDKPVIIIPAYNEEKYIGRTIDLIRATGIDAEIIVVDDGSKDRTAEIAKSKGANVVKLKANTGKANAFFAGLKEALRTNPRASCIVTIDADMIRIPAKSLKKLINEAVKATKEGKIRMIIAPVNEKTGMFEVKCPETSSGIRAFSLQAAWRLKTSTFKGIPKGYGLEYFMNRYFEGYSEIVALEKNERFVAEKAFRKPNAERLQDFHERITQAKLGRRIATFRMRRLR